MGTEPGRGGHEGSGTDRPPAPICAGRDWGIPLRQAHTGRDLWNEPENLNEGSYQSLEPPNKTQLVLALLPKVFAWARAMEPIQPLTSGVWKGDWSSPEKLGAMEKIQIEQS